MPDLVKLKKINQSYLLSPVSFYSARCHSLACQPRRAETRFLQRISRSLERRSVRRPRRVRAAETAA